MPQPLAAISVDNISQLTKLSAWGPGALLDFDNSPDGTSIAIATTTGVYLLDPLSLLQTASIMTQSPVRVIKFSPDGTRLAIGRFDGGVQLLDARDLHPIYELEGHTSTIGYINFSLDGLILISSGEWFDQDTRLWSVLDGSQLMLMERIKGNTIAISPDGQSLAIPVQNNVLIKRIDDGVVLEEILVYGVEKVQYSPDGTMLAAIADDTIRLWRINDGQFIGALTGNVIQFSSDSSILITWSSSLLIPSSGYITWNFDNYVRIWGLRGDASGYILKFTLAGVPICHALSNDCSIPVSPDGMKVVLTEEIRNYGNSYSSRNMLLYDLSNGELTIEIPTVSEESDGEWLSMTLIKVLFFPDSNKVSTYVRRNEDRVVSSKLQLWNLQDGSLIEEWQLDRYQETDGDTFIECLYYSPGGETLVSIGRIGRYSSTGTIDQRYDQFQNIYDGSNNPSTEVSLEQCGSGTVRWYLDRTDTPGPQSGTVIAEECHGKVCLRDLSTNNIIIIDRNYDEFTWIKFSPDGSQLAVFHSFEGIYLFRVSDGSFIRSFNGEVRMYAFSPDWSLLAISVSDMMHDEIRFFNVSDGSLLYRINFSVGNRLFRAFSLAFSPDGSLFGAALTDGTIHQWGIKP
jgi:WD40 repeat protein